MLPCVSLCFVKLTFSFHFILFIKCLVSRVAFPIKKKYRKRQDDLNRSSLKFSPIFWFDMNFYPDKIMTRMIVKKRKETLEIIG